MRSAILAAVAGAALFAAPVAEAAVSVSVERTCYAEGDTIGVEGSGFSPGGSLRVSLERDNGRELEATTDPTAEQDGTFGGGYTVDDETGWFASSEARFDMTLRAVDQTRLNAGQPADSPDVTATTSFIFSRWAVGVRTVGGTIHPSRPVSLNPVGFTNALGKPLFAHWMRNGKKVHTRKLGTLSRPCGDLEKRLPKGFPFRPVMPGKYQVRFSPSRTNTTRGAIGIKAATVKKRIP